MVREQVFMSVVEVDRLAVIRQVVGKRLLQREAAERLGVGVRQIKRLVRDYRERGAAGLVSVRRGRRPNNAIGDGVRAEVMALVRKHYADFGPTLACEKLVEDHGRRLSAETLRHWMIAEDLWKARSRRRAHIHQSRPRRPRFGELVQIDGSPHAWFEDRGPPCTLIVFVDDATSRLLALRFEPAETTAGYMRVMRGYLGTHGRPVAVYSDRHSIFRVNRADREGDVTQFTRVLKTLDIEPVHARSPQAKGRVERANQTLQDRLVKELRLRGIDDMESANAYLPEYMADYNRRFAVAPREPGDAHREVPHDAAELDLIHCLHATRRLSKNLTFRYARREYQIVGRGRGHRLRGAGVTVCDAFGAGVTVLHKGARLDFRVLAEGEAPVTVDDGKSVGRTVDRAVERQRTRPRYRPPPDHPWNRMARIAVADAAARRDPAGR